MMHRIRLAAFLVLLGGSVLSSQSTSSPAPQAQPQPPTFRLNVEYVEVDAVVTDRDGQFVRGLTKDDFQIFEDGKPQPISTFAVVDIPVERAQRPLWAPPTRSNRTSGATSGRSTGVST